MCGDMVLPQPLSGAAFQNIVRCPGRRTQHADLTKGKSPQPDAAGLEKGFLRRKVGRRRLARAFSPWARISSRSAAEYTRFRNTSLCRLFSIRDISHRSVPIPKIKVQFLPPPGTAYGFRFFFRYFIYCTMPGSQKIPPYSAGGRGSRSSWGESVGDGRFPALFPAFGKKCVNCFTQLQRTIPKLPQNFHK